ncbi:MAG: NRDE family protein, partial [Propionibacterium sp.]|nr:NRDE family protein [Propionibacterium sp.]
TLGQWWTPGVVGVLDELAGGAWLAADDESLAVLVNREGTPDVPVPTSRGELVLDAVAGRALPQPLTTLGFNLIRATSRGVDVTAWTGSGPPRVVALAPGTHMVSHSDVDDPSNPRVARWLDDFAAASTADKPDGHWWEPWVDVLRRTTELAPTDPQAIICDNRPHGYPTLSLLLVVASIGPEGSALAASTLTEPGRWNTPVFEPAR